MYFEGRFRGTGVGLVLNDANNDYDVQVDGATVATLVTPGQTTYWVQQPDQRRAHRAAGEAHREPVGRRRVRRLRRRHRRRDPGQAGRAHRQIEFIGDSWTAGYGNMSTTRDCTGNGGVDPQHQRGPSFGALTARSLNADYQINAWSGRGMVRNYNGGEPGHNFRTYYDRTCRRSYNSRPGRRRARWQPQVVVIGLGINDFSTALNAGEQWATTDALAADYRAAYHGFIDKLRARYGAGHVHRADLPRPVLPTTAFADSVQQIVTDPQQRGRHPGLVAVLRQQRPGLDLLGCDWHPSPHDDQIIAGTITQLLTTLPLNW